MNRYEVDILIPKINRKKLRKVRFKKWFCYWDYLEYFY